MILVAVVVGLVGFFLIGLLAWQIFAGHITVAKLLGYPRVRFTLIPLHPDAPDLCALYEYQRALMARPTDTSHEDTRR